LQFEKAFYEALIGEGTAQEAAKLLWDCARNKEPWAIQTLLQRLAPQESKLRLEVSRAEDDGPDYSKLTDAQIEQLETILETVQPLQVESGESTP
jgi:hypothetical protein